MARTLWACSSIAHFRRRPDHCCLSKAHRMYENKVMTQRDRMIGKFDPLQIALNA